MEDGSGFVGDKSDESEGMSQEQAMNAIEEEVLESVGKARLSETQQVVFDWIGDGLSTQQIAAELHRSRKTIESHMDHIKSKLGFKQGRQVVSLATKYRFLQKLRGVGASETGLHASYPK